MKKEKRCSKCKDWRLLKFFTKNKTKKDGRNHSCIDCHRKYVNRHYKKNSQVYKDKARNQKKILRAFIDSLKSGPCMDCRKRFSPWVMDFDHREAGEKEYNVSALVKFGSKPKILQEVKKCDLVCANCHRDRTHARQTGP